MDINEDMASTYQRGFDVQRKTPKQPKKAGGIDSQTDLVPAIKNVSGSSQKRQLPDYLKKLPYKLKALKMKNNRTPLKYESMGSSMR